jgi:valyl-tRNA synthetase
MHAGHDPNDYEIGKRVGLEIINIMNKVYVCGRVLLNLSVLMSL